MISIETMNEQELRKAMSQIVKALDACKKSIAQSDQPVEGAHYDELRQGWFGADGSVASPMRRRGIARKEFYDAVATIIEG